MSIVKLPQDLHIHTTFSATDSQVVHEQTVETVSLVKHAEIIGISDHIEHFVPHRYNEYVEEVRKYNFRLGTEVNGHKSVPMAMNYDFDYYMYHCWGDEPNDYEALKDMMTTGKPVIVAHPYATHTDLSKIPENALVEINNRYIWRFDWRKLILPYKNKFRWVIGSDAHQPHWLNQNYARMVAREMGIDECILFKMTEPEVVKNW